MITFSELTGQAHDSGEIAVIGIPWDGGTPLSVGASLAPMAIRKASKSLKRFDPALLEAPYDIARIVDWGDLRLDGMDQQQAMAEITSTINGARANGARTIAVGGDHLVTLPILRALDRGHDLKIVHLDAHSDTTDLSAAGHKFASATPFRRAIEEGVIAAKNILQVGIRGPVRTREKVTWPKSQGVQRVTIDDWFTDGPWQSLQRIHQFASGSPVYLSVDIDALDPAFAPGTGARVPGGLTSLEALMILKSLRGHDIVGCDLVEVSPLLDHNDLTSHLAANLIFEMLMLTSLAARNSREHGKT